MSLLGISRGRHSVLGIFVDAVDYAEATGRVLAAASDRRPLAVTALAVHGVMTGVRDRSFGSRLGGFDLVLPDGQPVRWALNTLHRTALTDRVYGPRLTLDVLAAAAGAGLPVYLYGSTPGVLGRLSDALRQRFPALVIAGAEPSKFRPARSGEAAEIADRIRSSGARLVLVGLGCPRQEEFVFALRPHVDAPLLAVGAAFDYHAGLLRPPPPRWQRHGLEWLWRLGLEPRRLWRRYLLLNPAYLARLAAQKTGLSHPRPPDAATAPLAAFPV
jgi:N-acetylglucosaminyldiphosphoundecaprenol N-acetyl-beta-D-mannosaminyltransferase